MLADNDRQQRRARARALARARARAWAPASALLLGTIDHGVAARFEVWQGGARRGDGEADADGIDGADGSNLFGKLRRWFAA